MDVKKEVKEEGTHNEHEEVLKIRSVRGTVTAGFLLYLGNFRRILKHTWLPALVCALVSTWYNMVSFTMLPQLITTNGKVQPFGSTLVPMMEISGLSLLNALVSLAFLAYGFSLLSHHREQGTIPSPTGWLTRPDWHMLFRTFLCAVVCIAVLTVCQGLALAPIAYGVLRQSVTAIAIGVLTGLAFMVLLLPLAYPTMRYVTSRDTRLFVILGPGYRQGLRRWGYLFGVLLVTMIITLLALVITTLPSLVLALANVKAQTGTLVGDPLGMPDYMTSMSFFVFLLAGFIQCYVVLLLHFPVYYMTGSIEKQEIEKNEKTSSTLY